MVFISHFRDVLGRELPALARHVETVWPAALLGSEGPDGWYFVEGASRPDTHMLEKDQPETWPGAFDRWLEVNDAMRPGRDLPPIQAAFLAGYLSHLGMDMWGELYFDPQLPAEMRAAAPRAWYPSALTDEGRVRAALRRLGEAPFPRDRIATESEIRSAAAHIPAQFHPEAVARVAVGILPALALDDPWESSRVNPLREVPRTAEARAAWDASRAQQVEASDAEYAALLAAASNFTLDLVRKWW